MTVVAVSVAVIVSWRGPRGGQEGRVALTEVVGQRELVRMVEDQTTKACVTTQGGPSSWVQRLVTVLLRSGGSPPDWWWWRWWREVGHHQGTKRFKDGSSLVLAQAAETRNAMEA
jgi:hypothetical protein